MPAAPDTRIRIVQSRHNPRVKELRAALLRPSLSRIGLEGQHLVEEALRSGIDVQTLFLRTGAEALLKGFQAEALARVPEILSIPEEVLRGAVTTDAPQAIAALAVPPAFTLQSLFRKQTRPSAAAGAASTGAQQEAPLLLVLAGVQDPGNVGTIVRSAEAFGANGVMALPGTASVWNPKSLRASMGSAFRLPVVTLTVGDALAAMRLHGVQGIAAVAPTLHASPAEQLDLATGIAFWIGNEGAGLAAELIERIGAAASIPCCASVESLNAAVAASVLLYEAARQRRAVSCLPSGGSPR
ncbi:MAG TPA: RNA methyltransferase [Acidobacteriaceae bacterium]